MNPIIARSSILIATLVALLAIAGAASARPQLDGHYRMTGIYHGTGGSIHRIGPRDWHLSCSGSCRHAFLRQQLGLPSAHNHQNFVLTRTSSRTYRGTARHVYHDAGCAQLRMNRMRLRITGHRFGQVTRIKAREKVTVQNADCHGKVKRWRAYYSGYRS